MHFSIEHEYVTKGLFQTKHRTKNSVFLLQKVRSVERDELVLPLKIYVTIFIYCLWVNTAFT